MYYILHYMYIYHTIHTHLFILCYIIYVYIIYLRTFFKRVFLKHYTFLSELLLHNIIVYICQNCICISYLLHDTKSRFFYLINIHLITFCCIYILHIFKHNTLNLHLTLSMLNYIHYRTN